MLLSTICTVGILFIGACAQTWYKGVPEKDIAHLNLTMTSGMILLTVGLFMISYEMV